LIEVVDNPSPFRFTIKLNPFNFIHYSLLKPHSFSLHIHRVDREANGNVD